LHLPENGTFWQIEVDGKWYDWNINREVKTPHGSRLLEFMPGDSHSDIAIPVIDEYQMVLDATELTSLASRRLHGGPVFPEERQALRLAPGKHILRVACIAGPARAGIYTPVRAVSNAVEIEILPGADVESSGASKEKSARATLAEAAARRKLVTELFHKLTREGEVPEKHRAESPLTLPRFTWSDIPQLLTLAESEQIADQMPASLISSYAPAPGVEGQVALWLIEGLRQREVALLRQKQNVFPGPSSGDYSLPLNAICLLKGMSVSDAEGSVEIHRAALAAYRRWWNMVGELSPRDAAVFNPFDLSDLHWFGAQPWEEEGELEFLEHTTVQGYVAWRRIRSLKTDSMKGGADRYIPDREIRVIYYGKREGAIPYLEDIPILRHTITPHGDPTGATYRQEDLVPLIVLLRYYDSSGKQIMMRSAVPQEKEDPKESETGESGRASDGASSAGKEESARRALAETQARRELVTDLFHKLTREGKVPEEYRTKGLVHVPRFEWSDIPQLLRLAESERIVNHMPSSPYSSYAPGPGVEGLVALWLIEGLRVIQIAREPRQEDVILRPSTGDYGLPLNALCRRHGMSLAECEGSLEIHRDALRAYRMWWDRVGDLPPRDAAAFDPLGNTDLEWFGSPVRKGPGLPPEKEETNETEDGKVFLGLDLSTVPHTTKWSELPDLFEARPPGSRSYHLRNDVVTARHPEKWILGDVLYIPRLDRFYVQSDPIASSTLTYYGPFEGEPWERLGIPDPRKKTTPRAEKKESAIDVGGSMEYIYETVK
jgi:hypothetical protein